MEMKAGCSWGCLTLRAAVTAAPLEMPTNRPSSLANLFAIAMLSSLLTCGRSRRHSSQRSWDVAVQALAEQIHITTEFRRDGSICSCYDPSRCTSRNLV